MKSNHPLQELKICTQLQYNGQLKIKSENGKTWTFYYCLGQLVWATGGTHPSRRLRRNLVKNCPYLDIDQLHLNLENTSVDYWDYLFLENLCQSQKIKPLQIKAIAEDTISEILFDLAQNVNSSSLICERNQDIILQAPMNSTTTNMFFKQMQEFWNNWSKAGLSSFSPDLAPMLVKPEELRKQVSPGVYKNLETLINGKHTLWDLAVKMKQSVLSITRSLLPYIHQGITALVEVPDLPLPVKNIKNNYTTKQKNHTSNAPLIACVDDSPQICQMLGKIITANGMRFLPIEEPVKALPLLIQNQPDFIFLDLIMPVVNGYELCRNLRRSSIFAHTPIVILTGSDGTFDRVRSKVFGATDFINKPVARDQVIGIVNKHLGIAPKMEHTANLAFCY
ncbi:response regulator [Sphaerospermopsis aphanizomenoides]|uniref:response regulator n=1 Tax=Sphaerospermopsis aphanizomenoides TaxID=459663 RepID=UPI001F189079|nr:response regulator [Sphaerospermopsis aphanizomenoides]